VNLKVGAKEIQQDVGGGANKNTVGDLIQDALQAGPQITPMLARIMANTPMTINGPICWHYGLQCFPLSGALLMPDEQS
jgi:hypothetical protein